ncbi:MAG: mycofactocin biosynthesis chaperone MftB [Deltaproteobacteria bacterium]|nr:mycofactocin biosynthesis chaperone MftB [Deltaproteobacteria bacterium]
MEHITTGAKYVLAPGTQVREEDFGLLFYTRNGPRLYFLSSGDILEPRFFQGKLTVEQWIKQQTERPSTTKARMSEINKTLVELREKGVILEQ